MYYVGIDIAKSFHVVTIIDENEVKVTQKPIRVTNCIDGHKPTNGFFSLCSL